MIIGILEVTQELEVHWNQWVDLRNENVLFHVSKHIFVGMILNIQGIHWGVFIDHIEEITKCSNNDHYQYVEDFEI